MVYIRVQSEWIQGIKEARESDEELQKLKEKTQDEKGNDFRLDIKGLLCFRGRCCVPNQKMIFCVTVLMLNSSLFHANRGQSVPKNCYRTEPFFLLNCSSLTLGPLA
jgi:hypothetical protein